MVGLGQVGQLEVDGEGFRKAVRVRDRQTRDERRGALHRALTLGGLGRLALRGGQSAQFLDRVEQLVARLLSEHRAEQTPERAHVALERRDLLLAVTRRQLRQTLALVFNLPQTLFFAHPVVLPFLSNVRSVLSLRARKDKGPRREVRRGPQTWTVFQVRLRVDVQGVRGAGGAGGAGGGGGISTSGASSPRMTVGTV